MIKVQIFNCLCKGAVINAGGDNIRLIKVKPGEKIKLLVVDPCEPNYKLSWNGNQAPDIEESEDGFFLTLKEVGDRLQLACDFSLDGKLPDKNLIVWCSYN
jgi:hypothetical protein